ncbi:MAG: preprotein translocase subunit YajC [Clostridia bacterium]|nr:preprotein translocase subunit YajC [Clostridia bacterium]
MLAFLISNEVGEGVQDGLGSFFSSYGMIFLMIAVIVAFYFFAIRPQQKKDKAVKEMRQNLSTGDRVTTIGGLFGRVVTVKDDVVTVEFGPDKMQIMVARWAIGSIEGQEDVAPKLEEVK